MNTIKKADWVTAGDAPLIGYVTRVARDGSWVDVNWPTHSKRMHPSTLTVQHTIQIGTWSITDITREQELQQEN